jgi:hypothetical protein
VTPQNTVFRSGHPVALIDFDVLVHPADRAPAFRGVDVPTPLRLFLDAYDLRRMT